MELMPDHAPRVTSFGVFEVDLRAGELRRNGVKVKIQNQPFQILTMLLERPGEVITRDEMRSRLWPAETFVDFDHGLNSAIRRLRDALGDSAESPAYVETLGRRGYRFVFPVEVTGNGDGHPAMAEVVPISGPVPVAETSPAPPVRRSWKLKAVLAVTVIGAAALLLNLSDGNSYLSRTRWGTQARELVIGKSVAPKPAVSQRRLTDNPADVPITS